MVMERMCSSAACSAVNAGALAMAAKPLDIERKPRRTEFFRYTASV
jgi:hypothetical protein